MLGRRSLLVIPAVLLAVVICAGCGPSPDATTNKPTTPAADTGDGRAPNTTDPGSNSMKPQKLNVDPSK